MVVVEAILALDEAVDTIDGIVFGIGWREDPTAAIEAIRQSVDGLGG